MKHIEVVAAIIERDGKYLTTQRGYGDWRGYWEFPGGKIEPGEAREEALVREIREELRMEIVPCQHLCTTEYDYPTFHLPCTATYAASPKAPLPSPNTSRHDGSAPKSCNRWSGYLRMWR